MKGGQFWKKEYSIALGPFRAQGGPSRARAQALKRAQGGSLKGPGPRPLRGPRRALKRARAQALKSAQGGS